MNTMQTTMRSTSGNLGSLFLQPHNEGEMRVFDWHHVVTGVLVHRLRQLRGAQTAERRATRQAEVDGLAVFVFRAGLYYTRFALIFTILSFLKNIF